MNEQGEITDFLTAGLDEDEVGAQAAHAGPWLADLDDELDENVTDARGQVVAWVRARPVTAATRAHIARHDPARALREVTAKRAILAQTAAMRDLAASTEAWFLNDLATEIERNLAAPYAEHPDYKAKWTAE